MTLSLNTLLLARQVLGKQTIIVNASRDEINAVLDARDELDAAIAAAQATDPEALA